MSTALLIAAGGAVGSLLRWMVSAACSAALARLGIGPLPLGTLLVNAIGSLLLGVLMGAQGAGMGLRPPWHAAVTIGVLGGFTTFSAYAYDCFALWQQGPRGLALAFALANNGLAIAAAALGYSWMSARAAPAAG